MIGDGIGLKEDLISMPVKLVCFLSNSCESSYVMIGYGFRISWKFKGKL